jgi:hypothetical protein
MWNKLTKLLAILFILFPLTCNAWVKTDNFEGGSGVCTDTGASYAGDVTTYSETVAHGGSMSCKMDYTVGSGLWTHQHLEYTFTSAITATSGPGGTAGEVWVRAYVYHDAGWSYDTDPNSYVKIMRIVTPSGRIGIGARTAVYYLSNEINTDYSSYTSSPQQLVATTPYGQWDCLETYIKAGRGTGIVRVWKNGILFAEQLNCNTYEEGDSISGMSFMDTWNAPGSATDLNQYWDDVEIRDNNNAPTNVDADGNKMIGPTDWVPGDDEIAPTIFRITSSKANGSYTVGEVIDIDVTTDESVTSDGNVTVTCETGDNDRTCTFTMTATNTGTCNYTVQAGDTSADLNCAISGTIADLADPANSMTDFTPEAANVMSALKAIVIDTTAPAVSAFSIPESSSNRTVDLSAATFTCTGSPTGYMVWESADAPLASNVSFTASAPTSYAFDSDGNKTLYAFCRDLAGNVSATGVSDTVTVTTSGVVTYFPCVIQ